MNRLIIDTKCMSFYLVNGLVKKATLTNINLSRNQFSIRKINIPHGITARKYDTKTHSSSSVPCHKYTFFTASFSFIDFYRVENNHLQPIIS